jgi:hypothetical protein
MPCPDPLNCPQKAPNGRCRFLLGTAATHEKIRRDCPSARYARDEADALTRLLDRAPDQDEQNE